ncbi:uncharacterized protein LOC143143584 [Ptiloglossa arizonensis]|uniref:uncharacterized protein LOC143143584 n=1 Tax=Ptiloglossa arizonensis TaxID=3350558 RepID=UPI003FA11EBB
MAPRESRRNSTGSVIRIVKLLVSSAAFKDERRISKKPKSIYHRLWNSTAGSISRKETGTRDSRSVQRKRPRIGKSLVEEANPWKQQSPRWRSYSSVGITADRTSPGSTKGEERAKRDPISFEDALRQRLRGKDAGERAKREGGRKTGWNARYLDDSTARFACRPYETGRRCSSRSTFLKVCTMFHANSWK